MGMRISDRFASTFQALHLAWLTLPAAAHGLQRRTFGPIISCATLMMMICECYAIKVVAAVLFSWEEAPPVRSPITHACCPGRYEKQVFPKRHVFPPRPACLCALSLQKNEPFERKCICLCRDAESIGVFAVRERVCLDFRFTFLSETGLSDAQEEIPLEFSTFQFGLCSISCSISHSAGQSKNHLSALYQVCIGLAKQTINESRWRIQHRVIFPEGETISSAWP
jgi:hypothetical protein